MEGLRHGTGELTFVNGDRYDGQWNNNEIHGKGAMQYVVLLSFLSAPYSYFSLCDLVMQVEKHTLAIGPTVCGLMGLERLAILMVISIST